QDGFKTRGQSYTWYITKALNEGTRVQFSHWTYNKLTDPVTNELTGYAEYYEFYLGTIQSFPCVSNYAYFVPCTGTWPQSGYKIVNKSFNCLYYPYATPTATTNGAPSCNPCCGSPCCDPVICPACVPACCINSCCDVFDPCGEPCYCP